MSTSFSRLIARAALLAALVASAASIFAQIPGGSSARTIPTEVEKSDGWVSQIIAKAEDHFRKGKLNLEDNKRDQARDEFDKPSIQSSSRAWMFGPASVCRPSTLNWFSGSIAKKFRLGSGQP